MSISAGPLGLGVGPPLGPSGPLNGPPPSSDQLLLTLRNKPHCRVFRALFQYLPLRDSPNDNPQLELPLNPGDVILVKGEMDSDGFFRGETLDGRTGLVPSNYVERVPDHLILQNARAPSPSFPLSVPPHLTTIQHDFTTEPPDTSHLPDSVCPFPPADVSKVTVQEIKQNDSPRVPCPRDLVVEKKLSRSLVISWSPPEESFVVVSQYHVCVDSSVRAVVPGSYKCRALIEDVALDHSVNVSVRAVTDQGHSPDQSCSIAVGNEAQVAPQHLRVWQVTPVSACVRWHPSNSNAEHVVSLNAVKVGVCPPSVYQVQLSGLTPSTIYRISIRTKHPRAVLEQRPVERCLDFKTLPKIGLPDPPINVQVEHGPQPGHLLVSWTPVCSQPKPPSRAAVSGYLVYADGKNIAQVPSETVIADHAVLRLADLSDDPPIFITVRTKTKEGAVSADSNVARVPRGSYTEPLLTAAPLTLDPMASSYPSYAQPAYATPNPYIGPMSGPTAATVQPMPGFWNLNVPTMIPAEAVSNAPVAPYSAPTMMTAIPFQANPLTSYATANTIQGYSAAAPTYDGTLPRMGTLTRGAGLAAASTIPVQPALQTTSHTGTLQGTLPKWKTPQSMSQYYTFHPRLLRADGSAEDARPSVLEMENSYLLRHRQNEWTGPTADGRTRAEIYTRGGIRAGSAEERMPAAGGRGRLVPPRLARVRSETGFGTRSEPDLRPPTLDDDCRWFVALFDYSHHMSPNANAEQEELSFRKHQLIKVYGEADGDGFYQGQIGNRYGLVPSNMVIEIAKNDLLPPYKTTYNRGEPMLAAEPALRRMRWGSLKSRSYDHAGDRRREAERPGTMYSSLDRRDQERREPPQRDRYRRANGRDYDYRRDYDDRYREASRDRRDEYYPREEDDYREREKYRYESRDRRDERRDERRDDRRGEYEDRRRREDDRYRRDRRDEGYREDRSFDYADKTRTGYDQGPGRPASQLTHIPGQSGPSGYGQSQMPGQQMGMGHLTSQMSQMHLQQGMSMQQQMPMEARMNGLHAQQQPSKHMIAKFDYDSRQLSPNADAEQTELSFKQGDMIAIYGEMDEDGFYMGELNGLKGLVPSNFLSEEPLTHLLPAMPAEQIMQRKGVAFSDGQLTSQAIPTAAPVKKAPTRQSSQTSTTPATNNISAGKPTAKKSTAGQGTGAKTLAKKTSDVGKKGDGGPAVRKTSTAVKKSDSTAKGSPSDSSMSKLFLGVFFTATTLVTFYSLLQASLILSEIRSFHSEFLEHNDDYLTTSNKVWELMQKEIGITTISREKRGSESSCGCESCRSGVNKCPSGPPGPPGNPGQKGDDGQPGERGLNGKAGVITGMFDTPTGCIACPQGEPGIQGAPGPQGPPGRNGVNGYRGNAGRSGAPGQAGPRGDQGRPGRNGNPGQPGQPGENGQRGKGESGPPGPAGPSGEYGAPGSPGPNGIDAQPGMPGVAGPAGKPGVPGTDGTNGARGGNGAPGPDAAYCPCPVRNQVFVSPADKTQEEERKKAIRKGVVFN